MITKCKQLGGVFVSVLLWLPLTVYATSHGSPPRFSNPLDDTKFPTLADFMNGLLNVIIIIGIPVVTLAIIYAGFLFISAQGNETKISSAKKIFFWVVIGSLIILGAKALAVAVQGTVEDLSEIPVRDVLTLEEDRGVYDFLKG